MPSCVSDRSGILSSLPPELLREVISHLDVFSLIAFLKAWPAIRNKFLVVSDIPEEYSLQPCFFKVPDLPIVRLKDVFKSSENSPDLSKVLITLFEFVVDPQEEGGLHSFTQELDETLRPLPSFDRFSFVFLTFGIDYWNAISPSLYVYMSETPLMRMQGQLYMSHIRGKNLRNTSQMEYSNLWYSNLCHTRKPSAVHTFTKLSFLEITGISSLDGISLPNTRELTLHFINDNAHDLNLSNIEAPKLNMLTIYYRNCCPTIANTDHIGSENSLVLSGCTLMGEDSSKRTCFRLIKVDAIDATGRYCLPECSTPLSLIMDNMDLGFTKNFQEHQIIGGHDILLTKLRLERVSHLLWMRTNEQPAESPKLEDFKLPLKFLQSFNFCTTVANTTLPPIRTKLLNDLGLIVEAPNFNPNGILDNDMPMIARIVICIFNDDWMEEKLVRVPIGALSPALQPLEIHCLIGCEVDPSIDRTSECMEPCLVWHNNTFWWNMKGKYADLDNDPETIKRMRCQHVLYLD